MRKVGNRIRITAQLVNVENGYHLWSETYDRQLEDVFAIQDEISRAIVDALKIRLIGDAQASWWSPTTENLEAYTLYLKGRFFFNRFTEHGLRKALDFFQQALAAGPRLRPRLRRDRRLLVQPGRRLGGAGGGLSPGQGGGHAGAPARPDAGRGASPRSARCSAGTSGTSPGREQQLRRAVELQPELRRGALRPRQRAAGGGPAGRGDRGDAEGAGARSALGRTTAAGSGASCSMPATTRRDRAEPQDAGDRAPSYFQAYLDIGAARPARRATPSRPPGRLPAGPVAEHRGAVLRRDDRAGARGPWAAGRGRGDPERLETQAKTQYLRAEVLAMGYAALGDLDRAFASLERRSRPTRRAHLPPPRSGLRAAAEGPAVRGAGAGGLGCGSGTFVPSASPDPGLVFSPLLG